MSIASPTIDSFELARSGRQLEGEVPVAQLPRLAEFVVSTQGALSYRIQGLIDAEGYPAADLQVDGPLQLMCQRCNLPLDFRIDRKARFRFVADEEQLNAMPIEDDEIESIVGLPGLNVHDWLEDEVILSLPLVPRHDDCSPPLSPESNSGTVVAPNPFAVLLELRGHDGGTKRHN
jgi:uncharacterized protein